LKVELTALSARHPAARAQSRPAVDGIDLLIGAGESVAVIGPSGAGKTTLLHAMACALTPSSGSLRLDDVAPWSLPRAQLQRVRARLFLAPQVPPLPPRQRVVTAVLAGQLPAMGLWRSVRSLVYPVDIPAAHDALDRFDLADKLFERVDRLSGGERQRVGLARALVAMGGGGGPAGGRAAPPGASVLLIDEPLSALDPTRARQAIGALVDGARDHGATLVATLHQVDVALAHFPRIVGLRDGRLAFDLPAAAVTRERLAALYDRFEHELRGEVPALAADTPAAPAPVLMHCR